VTLLQTSVRIRHDPDLHQPTRPNEITVGSWAPRVPSWAAAALVTGGYPGVVRRT
jgi:hypothetical protein